VNKMRKPICIISSSPVYHDGGVLRQIKYLSPFYDLNIIGYGYSYPSWMNMASIKWISICHPIEPIHKKDRLQRMGILGKCIWERLVRFLRPSLRTKKMAEYLVGFTGELHPSIYDVWFWERNKIYRFLNML